MNELDHNALQSITQLCTLRGDELKVITQLYTLVPADEITKDDN